MYWLTTETDKTEAPANKATVAGALCLFVLAVQTFSGVAWAQTTPGGICDRTPQVQTAILKRIDGVSDCATVIEEQLAAITTIDLHDTGISSLQAGDFAGLSSLKRLYLSDNALVSLPSDVFRGLTALKRLDLHSTGLVSLPGDVFRGLTALYTLDLRFNALETLPGDVFRGLTALESLYLHFNPGYPFDPTATVVAGTPQPAVPTTSGLDPSFPNPFNSSTQISYRLASPGLVRLTIYTVLGQPVRTLVDHVQAAGVYQVAWDARDQRGVAVAAGVYLTCLHYPGGKQTRRVLYLK